MAREFFCAYDKGAPPKRDASACRQSRQAVEEGRAPLLTFPLQIPQKRDLSYAETDAHVAGFCDWVASIGFSTV